jgi:YidC/Oxa1 family membrane protein insertase
MINIWQLLLYQPILNTLIFLYKVLFSNLGLAIIVLTLIIRFALSPIMNKQLKSTKKMQELAPELEKIKAKFKNDKQKLMQAQMELYKKNGVNPTSGCLPQIVQLIILISLYQAFNLVIKPDGLEVVKKINESLYSFNQISASSALNLKFLYLDLSKPDKIPGLGIPGLFVVMATVFQFLSSKLMMPVVKKEEKMAVKTENKSDDMASSMQKQMLYMFPLMTLVFGFTMPSGVMLYWFIFSLFSFIQQHLINSKEKGVLLK